ncbi:MAG: FkbM family methyltransferase [Bacteroidetes bacterium]|nr:FkbM family methyltransferase [Bacteroidota bacterium]
MKFILQTFFKGLYYWLTDKSFRTFVRLSIMHGSSKRYIQKNIRIPEGIMMVADAKSFIWQYYEIFFRKYYHFNAVTNQPLIIDCGSNIGLSILGFKRQYPQSVIHAFEADAKIAQILKTNIEKHQLKDVFVHENAVWTTDESLNFASEGADGGQISQVQASSMQVEGIDLGRFLNRFEHIDFLKMDIEGAETAVMPHIANQLHKIDKLFVEFHSYNGQEQKLNEVIQAISSAGHRIFIENVAGRHAPFVNTQGKYGMDLQLNIFAFKD